MTPLEFPEHPVPPVFIDDHGDVSVFRNVADAASWIEPIDVQNREYASYDSLGRLLDLVTDGRSVHISLAEREPNHAEPLLGILYSYLRACGDTMVDDQRHQLPQIVFHFMRYAEEPPQSLWQRVTSLFQTKP